MAFHGGALIAMILSVTPNPTLDRTLIVPGFRAGAVQRVAEARIAAGGKGLNVARVVRELGGDARCLGLLGGPVGREVAALAETEGLDAAWLPIADTTRVCTLVVDPDAGEATALNERGPQVTGAEWDRLADAVLRAAEGVGAVAVCGSLPPGVEPVRLAGLITALQGGGVPAWVDTSGPALLAALAARPRGLKINHHEASELLGTAIDDPAAALRAARKLRGEKVATVIVTLGRRGAVLADERGAWLAASPPVRTVSTIGSGDAFLAGILRAEEEGADLPEMLRRAVAAGAANTLRVGGGIMARGDYEEILPHVDVRLSSEV